MKYRQIDIKRVVKVDIVTRYFWSLLVKLNDFKIWEECARKFGHSVFLVILKRNL